MKLPHLIRILLLVALPLTICSRGSASALEGKVADVLDGGTITVISLKHPVKVTILGIAAPEQTQRYADAARQHLSDLVLNKFVVVRYSRLQDGRLFGKVMLGDIDVGAQMIRDGVAWYDKTDENHLSDLERQLYGESELAARNERRGLWQDELPVSPWEFRKAQLAKLFTPTVSIARPQPRARKGNEAGLSSDDLMGGAIGPGSIAGKPDFKPISSEGAPGRWLRYQPADKHFSILAPSDGLEVTYPILDDQGKTMDVHYVIGHNGRTLYLLTWAKGPNGNSTDASAAADAVKGIISGMNRSIERAGQGYVLTLKPGRDLKLTGYVGKQYLLSGGPVAGEVRILSKQIGDQREVFTLCVLNGPEDESSGNQFLNSFKIIRN